MERLIFFRNVIKEILTEYHQLNLKSNSTTESFLVFDEDHDQYLLLLAGWQKDERIKSVMIHIRLQGNKVWIEEDWTEDGVATELLQRGVIRDEIVLAFHPPQVRPYTEFATA